MKNRNPTVFSAHPNGQYDFPAAFGFDQQLHIQLRVQT